MNTITLHALVHSTEAWGHEEGRRAYVAITKAIDHGSNNRSVLVSLASIDRMDVTFAGEALVETAKRYKGRLLVIFVELANSDVEENLDAAAFRREQPVVIKGDKGVRYLGPIPNPGTRAAFDFVLSHGTVRASEFAANHPGVSAQNASMKYRDLWQKGYLLREEIAADSGGIEYRYIAAK